jgi:amino-acid N-acetyltransferase
MTISVRPATTGDVVAIERLIEPLVQQRILLGKDPVVLYESIQQFVVAEVDKVVVGCGALHVMWSDFGEIRTVAVSENQRGKGTGNLILDALEANAHRLGLSRLFCLTFETGFFGARGYKKMGEVGDETGLIVSPEIYAELLRSHDEGIAEFLDLARVKPNTLGNTRMLKVL